MPDDVTPNVSHEYAVPAHLADEVIKVIARKKKLDPATVTTDSTFEQLGVDSLDAADLLFTFEDNFHIVVPDEVAMSMKTVGQVVAALQKLLEEHGKTPTPSDAGANA
jgi:acyl carrier protein